VGRKIRRQFRVLPEAQAQRRCPAADVICRRSRRGDEAEVTRL